MHTNAARRTRCFVLKSKLYIDAIRWSGKTSFVRFDKWKNKRNAFDLERDRSVVWAKCRERERETEWRQQQVSQTSIAHKSKHTYFIHHRYHHHHHSNGYIVNSSKGKKMCQTSIVAIGLDIQRSNYHRTQCTHNRMMLNQNLQTLKLPSKEFGWFNCMHMKFPSISFPSNNDHVT